jgi:hypothetical protein
VLKPVAFWDSSVLVALCVRQDATPIALDLEKHYRIVVWWGSDVEIFSALARLQRRLEISTSTFEQAKQQAEGLSNIWQIVAPSAKITQNARTLLERYPLRAADALQLAAAIVWCEGKSNGKTFLTFDQRLGKAAEAEGFALK